MGMVDLEKPFIMLIQFATEKKLKPLLLFCIINKSGFYLF